MPNLGVVRKPSGDGTVFADIPGLIEGASQGVGLGHDFLRHIERTRLLLHLIDATSVKILDDYNTIQQELQAYGRGLPERPQVLALNKIDAVDRETQDLESVVKQISDLSQAPVFQVSAVTGVGLEAMLQQVWSILDQLNASEASANEDSSLQTEAIEG